MAGQVQGSGSTIWNDLLYSETDVFGVQSQIISPVVDGWNTWVTDTEGKDVLAPGKADKGFWILFLLLLGAGAFLLWRES